MWVRYIQTISKRDVGMDKQTETQGPPWYMEVINRRNGIQYGTKLVKVKPRKIKAKKPKTAAA